LALQVVETTSESETNAPARHPLRVFLVEDSAVILERLTESISSLHNVAVVGHAATEADAIATVQQTPCDAVVLDLQLRDGHGFNVLRALRAPSDRPRLTVIVLTNFTSSQYRGRSLEIGADYFFDKSREYDRVCDILEDLALRRAQTLD
jgi:two-component system OmpR family response regulator